MATLEQLKNLEVPEGYQNRAEYFVKRGNILAKDKNEGMHALNCYKKALKIYGDGKVKFPEYDFQVPISLKGFAMMMDNMIKSKPSRH